MHSLPWDIAPRLINWSRDYIILTNNDRVNYPVDQLSNHPGYNPSLAKLHFGPPPEINGA